MSSNPEKFWEGLEALARRYDGKLVRDFGGRPLLVVAQVSDYESVHGEAHRVTAEHWPGRTVRVTTQEDYARQSNQPDPVRYKVLSEGEMMIFAHAFVAVCAQARETGDTNPYDPLLVRKAMSSVYVLRDIEPLATEAYGPDSEFARAVRQMLGR